MNKQQAFLAIALIATVGIAGYVAIVLVTPEHADKFGTLLITVLVALAGFAGLKQAADVETIKKNTNGTLTRKDDEIATLRAALAERAPEVLTDIDTNAIEVRRKS